MHSASQTQRTPVEGLVTRLLCRLRGRASSLASAQDARHCQPGSKQSRAWGSGTTLVAAAAMPGTAGKGLLI